VGVSIFRKDRLGREGHKPTKLAIAWLDGLAFDVRLRFAAYNVIACSPSRRCQRWLSAWR